MPKTYYDSELTAEQIEDALTAIDGVVTPSNNGKVLYIDNGQIKAASASRWGHGAVLEPLSVTSNGDYTPPTGTDGFDEVHVAVPSATLTTKSITQNGTYNASQDNADGYSSVTVAVPGGATIEPLSVTQNGTYTPPSGVDGYAPVMVNIDVGPSLPSGYTKLNYIEGTGTQWIDTGLPAQSGFYIDMDLSIEANHTDWHGIFGGCDSNVVNSFSLGLNGMKLGALQYGTGGSAFSDEGMTVTLGTKYNVKMKNGTIVNKEFIAKLPIVSFTSVRNALIFARNIGADAVVSTADMRLYSLRIWVGDTLTRNYIPAMRDSDNAVGLFDVVSNTFFVNAGTGNFLYG